MAQGQASRLGELVADLVESGTLDHKGVLEVVREALRGRSVGKPDVEVMYNVAHGGEYDFTSKFYEFMKETTGTDFESFCPPRTGMVPSLRRFGEAQALKHPDIHRMVRIYHGNQLPGVFARIDERRRVLKRISDLEMQVSCAGASAFGTAEAPERWAYERVKEFSKASVVRWIAEKRAAIARESKDDSITPEKEARVNDFHAGVVPGVARRNATCFADAVRLHGHDSGLVWNSQRMYNSRIMNYNLAHPGDWPDKPEHDVLLEMGMLFATDEHSQLQVVKLPALVGYRIREYDGAESVCIL